jgi:hypothetical protein
MSYDENYERVEIEEDLLSEAQRIVIDGFMIEGEFRFREDIIKILEETAKASELEELSEDWVDGVRYSIHVIRNIKTNIGSNKS